jgi:hypothetical protein
MAKNTNKTTDAENYESNKNTTSESRMKARNERSTSAENLTSKNAGNCYNKANTKNCGSNASDEENEA